MTSSTFFRFDEILDRDYVSKLRRLVKDRDKHHEVLSKVEIIRDSCDLKQQIPLFKEVSSIAVATEDYDDVNSLVLGMLVNIYLKVPNKNTLKRVLASTFQNYSPHHRNKAKDFLTEQILSLITTCTWEKDMTKLRQLVDMISALMENFALGEEVLQRIPVKVVEFLSSRLTGFFQAINQDLSPVHQNEMMHHCLVTVQAMNRLLQKCASSIREDKTLNSNTAVTLENIFSTCSLCMVGILTADNFLLDCKTSGCMLMILLLKQVTDDHMTVIQQVTQLLFEDTSKHKDSNSPASGMSILLASTADLPALPMMCLYYGVLAQLDTTDLMSLSTKKSPIIFEFLSHILKLSQSCQDTSGKLLSAKSVLLWTIKACLILKSPNIPAEIKADFSGYAVALNHVIQYVWTIWEDTVDAIRFTAKDIFENVMKVHQLSYVVHDETDKFLLDTAHSLLFEVSWSCKGKFGTLGSVVSAIGSSVLLELEPQLPSIVLQHVREQTLSCYASDLFYKLSLSHLKQLTSKGSDLNTWMVLWVDPVLTALSGTDTQHKTHIIEYILPKLLKTGKNTLNHMIKTLSQSTASNHGNQLGALIMCLRRARVMGLLQNLSSTPGSEECLYGAVDVMVVKQALSHADDQVRLDAFALLCENHKTSESISVKEFQLMKFFLLWNMNNQSPSFRQHFIAHMKKLFARYKESEGSLIRKMSTKGQQHLLISQTLVCYKDFLSWLFALLLHSLYPGAAFARRTTCLSLLSLMVDIFKDSTKGFDLRSQLKDIHIQTLMECLTDTFEDNKVEAFKVLKYCCTSKLEQGSSVIPLASLFNICMLLAGSTKPQDCTSAAYLFKVLLLQPDVTVFLSNIDQQLLPFITQQENETIKNLLDKSTSHSQCSTEGQSQSGNALMLLWRLLLYLQDQCEVAKQGLAVAATSRPMYPTLHCMRYLLSDVQLKKLPENELCSWQNLIQQILRICLEISSLVSPIVQNSSPEGNVPSEALEGLKSALSDKGGTSSESTDRVMLMPEYLVVCCWRNVKEVSLLLGQLMQDAPIIDPNAKGSAGLLNVDQVKMIGQYFTKQLLESIHRGAFELACAGFVKQCEMLWKSNIRQLHQLPGQWLALVMDDVRSDDVNNKLCATRRSAGLPFFIQTLVTTEPHSTGRPCFKSTMKELIVLAFITDKDVVSNAKVHALNILRALFKDTRLGEVVTPYVSDGLKAAILGFQSPFWAVRNSATLLLSAMITRIFGVKRSKDETNLSKKNCQTGRQFFYQFPDLYNFLLNQLKIATHNISDKGILHLHPGLYPVLMILGRLFQLPLEGTDTSLNLAAFVPYITKCSASPVYKTRHMAARALQPLVQKDHLTSEFQALLSRIPSEADCTMGQSQIHGILLQVGGLLDMLADQGEITLSENVSTIMSVWLPKMWLLNRQNPCYYTRTEAFRISNKMCSTSAGKKGGLILSPTRSIAEKLQEELISSYCMGDLTQSFLLNIPGFIEYATEVASLYVDNVVFICDGEDSKEKVNFICTLLESPLYDVRLVVLSNLLKKFTSGVEDNISIKWMWESGKLMELVLERALGKEEHFECQIELFEVLNHCPLLQCNDWSKIFHHPNHSSVEVTQKCLNILESSTRDEVNAVVLEFTKWLIPDLVQTLEHVPDNGVVLRELSGVLLKSIGTEQSCSLQSSVAKVMLHNAEILLKDTDVLLGNLTFTFWNIVVSLQQEDDLEVKDIVSQVMSCIDHNLKVTLHPTLALDRAIELMVYLHGNTKTELCLKTMLSWLLQRDVTPQAGDERLFDKSEMNTFKEEVVFIQMVTKHIFNLLKKTGVKLPENCHCNLHLVQIEDLSPVTVQSKDMELKVQQLCKKHKETALTTMHMICKNFGKMTVELPFLKSSVYQEFTLELYKCVNILKITDLLCNERNADELKDLAICDLDAVTNTFLSLISN